VHVKEARIGSTIVLALEGRLDTTGGPMLESRIHELVSSGESLLILDCGGLTYVSSAGLRAILVSSKKAVAAGGRLSAAAPSDAASEAFEIAGLVKVLNVYPTLDAALASVQ
jgi:anti-anti-sigma factor